MPKTKTPLTEAEKVQAEIAELYPLLTGDDRREIALKIRLDVRSMERYANPAYGVKKLATGIIMRDEMKRVLAARQPTTANPALP